MPSAHGNVEVETPYGLIRLAQRRRHWRLATAGVRVEFGHARPVRVVRADGSGVAVPRVADPWLDAALGALVLWTVCALVLSTARWLSEWLSEQADGTSGSAARD